MTHPSSSVAKDKLFEAIDAWPPDIQSYQKLILEVYDLLNATPVTVPGEQREDKWIREMAAKEDGCLVNIGSPLEHVMLARTRDYNMVQDGAKQDQKIRELEAELSRLTSENESLKADREKMVAAKRKNR